MLSASLAVLPRSLNGRELAGVALFAVGGPHRSALHRAALPGAETGCAEAQEAAVCLARPQAAGLPSARLRLGMRQEAFLSLFHA